jgi:hypothetical protein
MVNNQRKGVQKEILDLQALDLREHKIWSRASFVLPDAGTVFVREEEIKKVAFKNNLFFSLFVSKVVESPFHFVSFVGMARHH